MKPTWLKTANSAEFPFTVFWVRTLPMLSLCLAVLAGCQPAGDSAGQPDQQRPVVIAINYPLASAAQRLAGEQIDLQVPVPADQDPAFWKPDDPQILALQQADLVLLNGAGHEPWSTRVVLSPLNVTYTARGFRDQWIKSDEVITHQHGPEGEHSHAVTAHTTWLDPTLFREQITVAALSLQKLLPDQREAIEQRLTAAVDELAGIDQQWQSLTAKHLQQPLLASHPVYQYPARRYEWNLKSLHWEPQEFPTSEQWQELDAMLAAHPARLMFWEAPPLEQTRQQLAERHIDVLVLPTLAQGDPSSDVLAAMRDNIEAIARQLDARPKE